jgi:starch-binding outer membrane protein, SusD/RagB family
MKMKQFDIWKKLAMMLMLGFFAQACESFLQVDIPKSKLPTETVYEEDETAIAALYGIYHEMAGNSQGFAGGAGTSVTCVSGLSSDELDSYNSFYNDFYINEILPQSVLNLRLWTSCYRIIYEANAVLNGITNSTSLSASVKTQLEGEAKFIRAFCHFYLVNLYGDVPLILTTYYRDNMVAPRTSVEKVYESIIADLISAKELLTNDYPSGEKVRVNKLAATALLARVYLYKEDWLNAEAQSTIVINSNLYDLNNNLDEVFLANSDEAIWQMIVPAFDDVDNKPTNEGLLFILQTTPGSSSINPVALSDTLFNSFESGDLRKSHWVGTLTAGGEVFHYPWKYKNNVQGNNTTSEYSMVLRFAEQYLIRAEARVHQVGKLSLAVADINEIRERAGLSPLSGVTVDTEAEVNSAIEQERKLELFVEWGHRWLDLKRTERLNIVMPGIKAGWESTDVLYPLPENEMILNPNLKPQNAGY